MEHRDIVCVILCGGQGKRMGSTGHHKVCFPIAGVPAIVRSVGMFKSVGLSRFLIVVGQTAEEVISTVTGEHPECAFVYQPSPRGTGHAAACAVEVLRAAGHDGHVLITMGDKIIRPNVVADLIARHAESAADLTLSVTPKSPRGSAGRIVCDSRGRLVGIVEMADIRRAAEKRTRLSVGGRRMTAAQVERNSPVTNPSVYLFKAPALYEAIGAIRDDNAQGELYLTDTLELIAAGGGRIETVDVPDETDLMAYNTPAELVAVEEVVGRRTAGRRRIAATGAGLSGRCFRPAGQWLATIESNPPRLGRALAAIYGDDESLLAERRKALRRVLERFVKAHGPKRRVVLARAPGRINLMGRHVDHRGGYVNTMAISREVLLAASPREDDAVTLVNLRPRRFPRREFSIGRLLGAANWIEWMDYINSATVRQVQEASRGDWSNYAKAAVLRLQHACSDHRLGGMDCVIAGNIPMGAGLSSSSAVVAAVAEAAVALNGLDVTTRQFVDLCGEGEWFVGAGAGGAEHAGIRSGERGRVARVGFFPFRIEETIAWPEGLSLVVANSRVRAPRGASPRDVFNHRVACYDLAEMLLRRRSAILASMEHLRDADPEALGVSPAEIYRAIRRLPVSISRRGAFEELADRRDRLEEIFGTHANVGPYRLRDVAMFGVAECRRSERFAALLREDHLQEVGELMRVSHDGDRVVRHPAGASGRFGRGVRYAPSYSDARLDELISKAADGEAALWAQPGRYACSTPEIDCIVDLARAAPAVIGAQLAGAGLGGCAMILAATEALGGLLSELRREYYRPRSLPFDVHVCRPVAGSGILSV